jgi:hypothetical protein
MTTNRCRACGAEIMFATTPSGKQMPLDVEPCEDGNVFLADGIAHVVGKGNEGTVAMPLYKSHFATCNDPARFRKKASKPEAPDFK